MEASLLMRKAIDPPRSRKLYSQRIDRIAGHAADPLPALARHAARALVRASNQAFMVSSAAMFIGLCVAGLMTAQVVAVSACGLVLVALGVRIGRRISGHLAPQAFRTAVLIVLAALGLGLILRAAGRL